ncbi:MAG: YlxR family protein [Clostridia bacterium]|nr:YlxR family protein [Clostridia bacterium]
MSATLRKIPERKCVGCNEKKPKNELIRIVRVADTGEIQIDATGKKNGRGAYICPSAACLKKAKKRLPASLETQIPEEIFSALELEMEKLEK